MRSPLKQWKDFEPAARQCLKEFAALHHRAPRYLELLESGHSWFTHAAKKYHGGFRQTLAKLGYDHPGRVHRPTRRNTWDTFATDVRPIIQQYLDERGHLPSQMELQTDGYQWVLSAAAAHHGGMIKVFERLGYDLRGKKCWSDWDFYAKYARTELTKAVKMLGHFPSVADLKTLEMSWIVNAAYEYHGGYEVVRHRLGFPPVPNKLRGRGLANWQLFAAEFRPLVESMASQLGRSPYLREIRERGYGRYASAVANHHGGYARVMRGWNMDVGNGQRTAEQKRWTSRPRQLAELHRHFPHLIDAGVLPSVRMVRKRCLEIHRYWNRPGRGYGAFARSFGLEVYKSGRKKIAYWQGVHRALEYYERHGHWPRPREMNRQLRHHYYACGGSWEQLLLRMNVTSPLGESLIARHKQHYHWRRLHQPEHAPDFLRVTNQIIITMNDAALPHPTL